MAPIRMSRKDAEEVLKKHWTQKVGQAEAYVLLRFVRRTGMHELAMDRDLGMKVRVIDETRAA